MAETAYEPLEPLKHKTCVLKASIHCEGCKRKVKKILSQVQGVDFVEVDTKQQRVAVTGSVAADTLIKQLVKSGKHAELWPQKYEKRERISRHGRKKEKETRTESKIDQQANSTSDINAAKEVQPSVKVQPAAKICEGSGGAAKVDCAAGKYNEVSGGGPAATVISDASEKTSVRVQETKSEGTKTEEACSVEGEPPHVAEEKEGPEKCNAGGGSGGAGGTDGKKKKKKGESGNLPVNALSSAAAPSCTGSENYIPSPPLPTNHRSPHHLHIPHHDYAPPPPVYAVSYNTVYPTSSYTAAAAPAPYSYAYAYPGLQNELPQSDNELYSRQPLDSFEIFSDENPNGCSIA